jgi:hypothetical protein
LIQQGQQRTTLMKYIENCESKQLENQL